MELKYLIARWNGKRMLFLVSPEEEYSLREKLYLASNSSRVFITGDWVDTESSKRKLERWVGKVERWVVTSKPIESELMSAMLCEAHLAGTYVEDLDSFLLEVEPVVPANANQLIHLLARNGVKQDLSCKIYSRIKYAVEPLIALTLFIFFLPVMLLVALAIKLTSHGPVLYSQERVGYKGRVFRIFKFRSMVVDAEKGKARWAQASKNDPSLTPIGGFLRASHLDELPQLWNIIRGDLSFIGPRPERPEFVDELTKSYPLFKLRPLIKPGITGWAQINQGYANTISDSVKKLELDLFYMIKHSPRLDAKIAIMTILVLFSGGTEEIKRNRVQRVNHSVAKPLKVN